MHNRGSITPTAPFLSTLPIRSGIFSKAGSNGRRSNAMNATCHAGVGTGGEWRLALKALTRAGVVYPEEGVPFTLVMTISDPKEEAPIYEEVRAESFGAVCAWLTSPLHRVCVFGAAKR